MRWKVERRADMARVNNLAAAPFDPPLWLQTFRHAYARPAGQKISGSANDLLAVVEPILADARRRLEAALRGPASGISPTRKEGRAALIASLELGLRRRLWDVLSRTLVLELAVASRRDVLRGETTEQRFAFFCECLGDHKFARALLGQYPVLVRRIITMANNWETSTVALLLRLSESRHALCETFFGGDDPGPLVSAKAAGDTHCGGQAVRILHFEAGHRLVYKPRSVALEGSFFTVVSWFNRNGGEPDLKEIRTLDEGAFGWMEFVEAKPCQTRDEIERFFIRQGAQIALTYVLGATDLHSENVIAHGEYPVLVDLETMFQGSQSRNDQVGATAVAWRILEMSVMGTLLLPKPIFLSGDANWIDLSALGHGDGQLTPFQVPVWRAGGTDRMRLSHERIPMPGGISLPEYESMRELASPNVELVVRGLHHAYQLVRSRKTELLSSSGPLASAVGNPSRRIFRSTSWYGRLFDASNHPRFLGDAVTAEAFLHDQLRKDFSIPVPMAVEDAEVADLFVGDIPYFVSRVGEPAPLTESGNDEVPSSNGWEECRARVEAMSEPDLDRQTWLARVAMTDLGAPAEATVRIRTDSSGGPSPEQLIVAAARIGDRICDLAIKNGDGVTWLVPTPVDKRRLHPIVADLDLYSGLPGIALFLGHLGGVTGDSRYGRVAAAAMAEALAIYSTVDREVVPVGAYGGIGGLCYALLVLANLLGHPRWINDATDILQNSAKRALHSSQFDIVSGQAGFVIAALAVHRHTNDASLIGSLRPLAKRLLRLATVPRRSDPKLPPAASAGLAHGRAGVGFALSRWAEATGDENFDGPAAELIGLDLAAIAARSESPEFKVSPKRDVVPHLGWCRGWLGAALATLRSKSTATKITPDQHALFQRIADEIIAFGVDGPLCLCHGALGHMEFLRAAEDSVGLSNPDGAATWRDRLFARLIAGDWVADDDHRLESPGLMLGLAGTGYSLLRAVRPQLIPSVLTIGSIASGGGPETAAISR